MANPTNAPAVPGAGFQHRFLTTLPGLIPGLALTGLLAVASMRLAKAAWLQDHGISALTLAIVLGIVLGNTLYPRIAHTAAAGVGVSKQTLLRAGVILYGLRLTFQDIGYLGINGILIDAVMVTSTFCLAWLLGTRVFGLPREAAMLIGTGSAVCGAAAVMAAEPVVRGRSEHVTIAVSTVVVFGTLALFVYPLAYHLNEQYHLVTLPPLAYGVYAGSTIHEVAQVVAAAHSVDDAATNTAVIAKMVRVMMLSPFLLALSAYLSRTQGNRHGGPRHKIVIPWFAIAFVGVAALNSVVALPQPAVHAALGLDTVLLAMAMAALGLSTHIGAVRSAGIKPLALAGVLFLWLMVGGLAVNLALLHLGH